MVGNFGPAAARSARPVPMPLIQAVGVHAYNVKWVIGSVYLH